MINVKICIADMPSYTYAVKAERLLRSHGCHCSIIRKDKALSSGCGFMLKIYGTCNKAADILDTNAIPYTMLYDDGGA